MDEQPDKRGKHWTVDRHIPIVLVAIQTAGAVWWAAAIDQRLASVEIATSASVTLADRVTRVEVDFTASKTEVSRRLDRIEAKIDRILEGRHGGGNGNGPYGGQ